MNECVCVCNTYQGYRGHEEHTGQDFVDEGRVTLLLARGLIHLHRYNRTHSLEKSSNVERGGMS